MGDWRGNGVRPNVARRKAAVAAMLLATSLCVACAGGGSGSGEDATASSHDGSAKDARPGVPSISSSVPPSAEPSAAPAEAGAEALPAAPLGVGLIACPEAFVAWATTTSGLDVDTVESTKLPLVPERWHVDGFEAPSCAFSGDRDGADPLSGEPRRISTIVLAYLSDSRPVLEAAYADARTTLKGSSLTFASESSDAGLQAAQYFHDGEGGVVDATLTVTMRLEPPFAADAGLETGVGLLLVRGALRVALPNG